MKRIRFVLCTTLIFLTGAAQATTVLPESGEVLVNYGAGYLPVVAGGSDVLPGTTVLVRPGATAIISYGNCRVRVGDQKVWSIESTPPCPQGTEFLDLTSTSALPNPGLDTTTLLIGGAVVGGGIAAAIALSGGDDDKCVSAC